MASRIAPFPVTLMSIFRCYRPAEMQFLLQSCCDRWL